MVGGGSFAGRCAGGVQADQHHTVAADEGGELSVEDADVLLTPKVADDIVAGDAKVGDRKSTRLNSSHRR